MIIKEKRNNNGFNQASKDGFYLTKEWQSLRLKVLNDNPFCVRCSERGYSTIATVVNHIQPVDKNFELRLDINNCESLCERCHQIITRQDHSKYNRFLMKKGETMLKKFNDFNK